MTKTISQLPQTTTSNNVDFWHVSQGGADKKITTQDVASLFTTGSAFNLAVKDETASTRVALAGDKRSYLRFVFGGTSTYTISDVASGSWRLGDVLWVKADGGSLTVSPAAGVVINEVESVPQGKQAILRYVDGDEWDFILFTDVGGGGGGGTVDSVVGSTYVTVNDTDPSNPVVSLDYSVTAGSDINIDNTDPNNPVVSSNFSSSFSSTGYTLSTASDKQWINLNGVGAKDIICPLDSTINLGEEFVHIISNTGAGTVTITKEDPGVEILAPPGGTLIIPQNATAGIKKVAGVADTYIVFGSTESVSEGPSPSPSPAPSSSGLKLNSIDELDRKGLDLKGDNGSLEVQ